MLHHQVPQERAGMSQLAFCIFVLRWGVSRRGIFGDRLRDVGGESCELRCAVRAVRGDGEFDESLAMAT